MKANLSVQACVLLAALTVSGACAQSEQAVNLGSTASQQYKECLSTIESDDDPPKICSTVLSYLGPDDHLIAGVGADGSFTVMSPKSDGKVTTRTFYLPPVLRSQMALNWTTQTIREIEWTNAEFHDSLYAALLPSAHTLWPKLVDVYCYYHPEGKYKDLIGTPKICSRVDSVPDERTLESDFNAVATFQMNDNEISTRETEEYLEKKKQRIPNN